MTEVLKYKAICDIGSVRTNNEDMAYVVERTLRDGQCDGEIPMTDRYAAFAVADGMGGYEGGEIASEIVCRSFGSFIRSLSKDNAQCTVTLLKDWAKTANQLVLDTAALRPELSEMGTTFVSLIWFDDTLWLINIGDSRCYRIRNGVLKQLSTDHSERVRTGNPNVPSNLIYNFMGNNPDDFISDVTELMPIAGDIYLLCSDGLSDLVADEDIEQLANQPDELVKKAKDAGGRDNITVISIQL